MRVVRLLELNTRRVDKNSLRRESLSWPLEDTELTSLRHLCSRSTDLMLCTTPQPMETTATDQESSCHKVWEVMSLIWNGSRYTQPDLSTPRTQTTRLSGWLLRPSEDVEVSFWMPMVKESVMSWEEETTSLE